MEAAIGSFAIEVLTVILWLFQLILFGFSCLGNESKWATFGLFGLVISGGLFIFRLVWGLFGVPLPPGMSVINLAISFGFFILILIDSNVTKFFKD